MLSQLGQLTGKLDLNFALLSYYIYCQSPHKVQLNAIQDFFRKQIITPLYRNIISHLIRFSLQEMENIIDKVGFH